MVMPSLVKHCPSVSSGLTDQPLPDTFLQVTDEVGKWNGGLILLSLSLLPSFFSYIQELVLPFFYPLWLFHLQHGASCCDHLLAVPSYQSQCLCISDPSCKQLWNSVGQPIVQCPMTSSSVIQCKWHSHQRRQCWL